ncbi:hypothetical protein BX600DRAFT_106076 [Xylariales sp. PMI_506]|nr:hypothetical protein BX600DRAFT_106076 [Xylariales sp. PMI_506]
MEAVGAVASFIAIGQAFAAIPSVIQTIRSVCNAREELLELVFELEMLTELYSDVQLCLEMLASETSPLLAQAERPYIRILRTELDRLMDQFKTLAKDCQVATDEKHVPKDIRAKWLWQKSKIAALCDRVCRIKGNLESAMNALAFRQSLSQNKLLLEIHTFTRHTSSLPRQQLKSEQLDQLEVGSSPTAHSPDSTSDKELGLPRYMSQDVVPA